MAYFHKNLKYHEDNIEKRKITKEDIDFLKELQKERNTQDNCGTAQVRTWVINDRNDKETIEENADYMIFYRDGERLSIKELYEILKNIEDNPWNNKDYYTEETVIKNIDYTEDVIRFKYLDNDVYIKEDNDNEDGIVIKGVGYDELVSFLNESGYDDLVPVFMEIDWIHRFCFLTQKAAENHLRKYGYNHSEDAHTYCICTYRDPEIAKLVEIIETVDWEKVKL